MVFGISFAGARVSIAPSATSAANNDAHFAITGVRHLEDGHIEIDVRSFSGKIILEKDDPRFHTPETDKDQDGKRKKFVDKVAELSAYKRDYGTLEIDRANHKELARFCTQLRHSRRNPDKASVKLNDARIAALDALNFDWDVQRKKLTFSEKFEELKAYREQHGHFDVKDSENKLLAKFCYTLRYARKNPEKYKLDLNDEHIKSLDDLGFSWESTRERAQIETFATRMHNLRAFKEEHGHLAVSKEHSASLASFCARLRKARRNPEREPNFKLTKENIALLDEWGFDWCEGSPGATFDEQFEDLKKYHETNGHLNVERKDNRDLYNFCKNLRYERNHPEEGWVDLTEEQIASLDALGFQWTVAQSNEETFLERIEELKEFKEAHGHLKVEKNDDQRLFDFCSNVRQARRKPGKGLKLTDDRIAALGAIGFVWKRGTHKSFNERVEDLKRYYRENGNFNVKRDEDKSLADFCYNMRFARRNPNKGMKLTEDRIASLDAIGFPWTTKWKKSESEFEQGTFSEGIEEILRDA